MEFKRRNLEALGNLICGNPGSDEPSSENPKSPDTPGGSLAVGAASCDSPGLSVALDAVVSDAEHLAIGQVGRSIFGPGGDVVAAEQRTMDRD